MNNTALLTDKRAIVFGAGGSIGSAVAREFAAEGAEVFLAGRTQANIEAVAKGIVAEGGRAHAAQVDAADGAAVDAFVEGVAKEGARVDILFNAVGPSAQAYGNGKHAIELAAEEFMTALEAIVKPQFVTARAAARRMIAQGTGVILFLTGSPARGHVEGATAIGAIETLTENLAVELSPKGVRVLCLRATANVDSRPIQETLGMLASRMNTTKEQMIAGIASSNFLKRPMNVADTAKAAAFLVSDRARMMTATVVNSTAGAAAD
jgi:NAD(P)-dependent dehydrogenase (short-subunit alcohol dehydrogenase family)